MYSEWASYIFTGRSSKTFPPADYLTWVLFWYHPSSQLFNRCLLTMERVHSRKWDIETCSSNNCKNAWHWCVNMWTLEIRTEQRMFSWYLPKVSIFRSSNCKTLENGNITLQLSTTMFGIQRRWYNEKKHPFSFLHEELVERRCHSHVFDLNILLPQNKLLIN